MKRSLLAALALIAALHAPAALSQPTPKPNDPPQPPAAPAADAKALAGDNLEFALRLHQQLAKDNSESIFFSPYSISQCAAMVHAGARGDTATEFGTVFNFKQPVDQLLKSFAEANKQAAAMRFADERRGKFNLNFANSLWVQDGLALNADYTKSVNDTLGAGVSSADYKRDADAARKAINAWVASKTNERIKELLTPGTVSSSTRLVLVNAVWFKAKWMMPFDSSRTQPADFKLADGKTAKVPMMRQSLHMHYSKGEGWQAVTMGYANSYVEMIVLLPDDGKLADVEKGLDAAQFAKIATFNVAKVNLQLPKITAKYHKTLNPYLAALGLKKAFSNDADFSGITTAEKLALNLVIHEANVDVTEEGTEAAAATAMGMRAGGVPRPEQPVEFVVDRPFFMFLRDSITGTVLFMGRIMDPGTRSDK